MSDPLLPDDAVALGPETASEQAVSLSPAAVPNWAITNGSAAVPSSTVLPDLTTTTGASPPVLGSKGADVLLLYDAMLFYDEATNDKKEKGLREQMALYAQYFLGGATQEKFYGFKDLVAKLQAYKTIGELILYIHGAAGVLEARTLNSGTVVTENYTLSQIVNLFQGVAPLVTQQVILESCVVADNPSQMVELKRLFQTPRITGWNYFHILEKTTVQLGRPASSSEIQAFLIYPDEYLMLGMPHPTTLAGQTGTFPFLYEWFRRGYDLTPPGLNPDRRDFVPRGQATTITLFSTQASCMTTLKNPAEVNDLITLCNPQSDQGRVLDLAQVTIRD